MKVFLNVGQAQIIRDALYTLSKNLKGTEPPSEGAEAELQEIERLTTWFNAEIEREL